MILILWTQKMSHFHDPTPFELNKTLRINFINSTITHINKFI